MNNQSAVNPPHQSHVPISPGLAAGQLSQDGLSSSAISLLWGPLEVQPGKIQIQYSKTGPVGPFTVADAAVIKGNSAFVGNLTAGATYWWRLADSNGQPLGKSSSTIKVAQPSAASLNVYMYDLTTIKVDWDNGATYGGVVMFDSYELMMSALGSTFGPFATTHTVNNMSASLLIDTSIREKMNYTFYLRTIDKCITCSSMTSSVSQSRNYSILTPPYSDLYAGSPTLINVGGTVIFDCDPGRQFPDYVWMFGDGPMVDDSGTVTHKYSAPGSYRVQCGAISFNSDFSVIIVTDSYPTYVSVFAKPLIEQPKATPYSIMDVGENVTFATHASLGLVPYLYTWTQLPAGCASENKANVTCHLSSAGTFAVAVKVTDRMNVNATSLALVFSVQPSPFISSFTAYPSSLKTGEKTTLTILTTGGTTPYTYTYTGLPSGCTSSNSATITCTPSSSGLFNVNVTATDHSHQKASSSLVLNVTLAPHSNPPPSPNPPPSSQPSATSPLAISNNTGMILGMIIGLIAAVAIAGLLLLRRKHVI